MREAHIVMDNVKDEFEVKATYDVDIIRIADYIKNIVGTRAVPEGKKGVVAMKLDVEGKEIPILTDIIHSGALQFVDNIHYDWHNRYDQENTDKFR